MIVVIKVAPKKFSSFCLQICSLLWPEDYGELVSSHGSTTPEKNDIILWRMHREEYEFEPQARLRQHTSRALHLALSPDKTTVGGYHFKHRTLVKRFVYICVVFVFNFPLDSLINMETGP